MDFFTVETWTSRGLKRFHVLFVIDLATRRVEVVGVTDRPHWEWVRNALRRQLERAEAERAAGGVGAGESVYRAVREPIGHHRPPRATTAGTRSAGTA